MMKSLLVILLLLTGGCALANPIAPPPPAPFLTEEVLPWVALLCESVAVCIMLYFLKLRFLPTLIVLGAANVLAYYYVFTPLLNYSHDVIGSEAIIVAVDAVVIQCAGYVYILQRDEYKSLKVYYSLLIAVLGNLISWAILH